MAFGITPTGFVRKTQEDIKGEVETSLGGVFGTAFNPELRPIKEIIGIFSFLMAFLWELAESAYNALNPTGATGAQLDNIGALRGTARRAATKGTVTATVNLDAATTLSAGAIAAVDGNPDSRFVTLVDVTSVGAGNYSVEMQAESTGIIAAAAGTLTDQVSASVGWNSITNALDAVVGAEVETDAAYLARQEVELAGPGGSSVDGIEADVSAVDAVTYVRVYENVSDVTDGDGLPPHSFETVTLGGVAADIAQAIWDSKPAGIATHGDTTTVVTDDAGRSQNVEHTAATSLTMYVTLDLYTRAVDYAGDAAFKDAVVAAANAAYNVGNDVIVMQLNGFALDVAGVVDINADTKLDDSVTPVPIVNFIVARDELASFDASRIVVTTTEATTD